MRGGRRGTFGLGAGLAFSTALLWASAASLGAGTSTRVADRIRGQAIAAAHPPMEEPTALPAARAAHMRDDDVVLGLVAGGETRAYPWWVAKNFHVVNDTVAGVPVVVALCEQCTGAAAFRRVLDGRVLSLETAGVYNGTIILRDRETKTLWAPFSGKALEGPLAGRSLDRLPLALLRWSEWRSRHPGTTVVWGPQAVRAGHGSWYEPGKWGIVGEMGATLPGWDARLAENVLVYGLEVPGATRSYPLPLVRARGVVNDTVAGVPVAVLARGELEVVAYDRRLGVRRLEFSPPPFAAPPAVMVDRETQSGWSGDGVAISGPLSGERLSRLDGYVVEWHVWAAYNPQTSIFGPAAAPAAAPLPHHLLFPTLRLATPDGRPAEEVELTGTVNLVALWTTWCAPCRAEMPALEALRERHAPQGLAVLGIALHMPEDPAESALVRAFLSDARITFPNRLVDEAAYDALESLLIRTGRPGLVLPTVLVVDKSRRVRAVFQGKEVDSLPAALPRLLGSTD